VMSMNIVPIKSNDKIYMAVIKQVHALLQDGQLVPGDKLPPERELAQLFGVSRASVRQAISALEALGVIKSKQGGGTYVSEEAPDNGLISSFTYLLLKKQMKPSEIIETRIMVECYAASLCAARAEEETLQKLNNIYKKTQVLASDNRSRIDKEFHITIAEGTGNNGIVVVTKKVLEMMNYNMWPLIKGYSLSQPGRPEKYQKQHFEIYSAIKKHDGQLAYQKMKDHLEEINKDFEKDMDEVISFSSPS
jgi:GntR family transcriptional regulator, transcriptional repressor for pyruvate dehydrogenase complex